MEDIYLSGEVKSLITAFILAIVIHDKIAKIKTRFLTIEIANT